MPVERYKGVARRGATSHVNAQEERPQGVERKGGNWGAGGYEHHCKALHPTEAKIQLAREGSAGQAPDGATAPHRKQASRKGAEALRYISPQTNLLHGVFYRFSPLNF